MTITDFPQAWRVPFSLRASSAPIPMGSLEILKNDDYQDGFNFLIIIF